VAGFNLVCPDITEMWTYIFSGSLQYIIGHVFDNYPAKYDHQSLFLDPLKKALFEINCTWHGI